MTDHKKWESEMSSEFNVMMDGIRSEPMPDDSLERSLQAAEAIVMTKASLKRGKMNAMIVAAIMYPIVGAVAYAISKRFEVDLILAVGGMFAALFAIIFPFFLASMAIGRARAGEVLLDCGPFPSRKLFGAMSVLMFVVSVGTAISATETFANLIAAFFCGLALYLLIASTGRLQICENGVFQYWSLLRWNKIKSYRWEGTTDATLMLQTTNSFAFLGRGALPVAIEQKDAVDALMQQHVA